MTMEQRFEQALQRTGSGVPDEAGADDRLPRRRTRRAAAGAGLTLALLLGLALIVPRMLPGRGGPAAEEGGQAGMVLVAAVPWQGARLDGANQRKLVVSFTGGGPAGEPVGPCSPAYEGTAEVGGDAVVVAVHALLPAPPPSEVACTSIGYARTLTVALPEPLRGRRVVDGANGQAKPVVEVALRQPSYLPPGYRQAREETDGGVVRLTWTRDDEPQGSLEIAQGGPLVARLGYRPVVLRRTAVHGSPASLWKSSGFDDGVCLSWAEGSAGLSVCSTGSPKAPLPAAELLRIADGLR